LFPNHKQLQKQRSLKPKAAQRPVALMQQSPGTEPEDTMSDISTILANLRRPRLLIRAARHGIHDYRRDRDLRRLIDATTPPSPETAFARLRDAEEHAEETRRAGDAGYSLTRHVDLLIAMLAEARLLRNPTGI
jgi:hypothetical protein